MSGSPETGGRQRDSFGFRESNIGLITGSKLILA